MKIINIILNKLFTVIRINKSPFKNKIFSILLIIGIISSIILRLDFIVNLFNKIPSEIMFNIKIISALYSIILIFLLMINIKQCIEFIKIYFNNYFINKEYNLILDNSILYLYLLYILYIILLNIILSIINYYSILSLNIEYLEIIYLSLIIISLLTGIYYSIYKFNSEFDLYRTLTFTGKICFIGLIIIYAGIFIGLRSGIILEWLINIELFEKIHCEGTGLNTNNLNNRLRDNNEPNSIIPVNENSNNSNSNNSGAIVGTNNNSVNVGDNSTASNITVNPSPASSSNIIATRTTTETIIMPITSQNNNNSEMNPPIYSEPNNSNSVVWNKFEEIFGIFNQTLRDNSMNKASSSKLPFIPDDTQSIKSISSKSSENEKITKIVDIFDDKNYLNLFTNISNNNKEIINNRPKITLTNWDNKSTKTLYIPEYFNNITERTEIIKKDSFLDETYNDTKSTKTFYNPNELNNSEDIINENKNENKGLKLKKSIKNLKIKFKNLIK